MGVLFDIIMSLSIRKGKRNTGRCHVTTEAEIEVTYLCAKEPQVLKANNRTRRSNECFSPKGLEEV